ncbi:MAG: hypothetical protein ACYCVH_08165 [Ignavibacteriaceae bacterium]
MNKIILQFGLLTFFLSVIFFSRMGLSLTDLLFKSFIIFIATTVMLSIIVMIFIKAINKVSLDKKRDTTNNINGK